MKNLSVKTNNNGTALNIIISGELTIKNAETLYSEIKSIQKTYKSYEVEMMDVAKIDVSAVQILMSFYRGIVKQKKNVTLQFKVSEEVKHLLENAGMYPIN